VMSVGLSLYLVFIRNKAVDLAATLLCVMLMSVPVMVYVIFGQFVVAQVLIIFQPSGSNSRASPRRSSSCSPSV